MKVRKVTKKKRQLDKVKVKYLIKCTCELLRLKVLRKSWVTTHISLLLEFVFQWKELDNYKISVIFIEREILGGLRLQHREERKNKKSKNEWGGSSGCFVGESLVKRVCWIWSLRVWGSIV